MEMGYRREGWLQELGAEGLSSKSGSNSLIKS